MSKFAEHDGEHVAGTVTEIYLYHRPVVELCGGGGAASARAFAVAKTRQRLEGHRHATRRGLAGRRRLRRLRARTAAARATPMADALSFYGANERGRHTCRPF